VNSCELRASSCEVVKPGQGTSYEVQSTRYEIRDTRYEVRAWSCSQELMSFSKRGELRFRQRIIFSFDLGDLSACFVQAHVRISMTVTRGRESFELRVCGTID